MEEISEFFLRKTEVLNTEEIFIREPVEMIIDKINNSNKNKIILTGEEDSGKKLTIMKYMECKDNLYVYLNIKDLFIELSSKNNLESYIEYTLTKDLLNIIQSLGINSQMLQLKSNIPYIDKDINNIKNYVAGDLICPLLYRIGKITNMKVILIIDKLDLYDKQIQNVIKKYIDIFSKSIIITNDTSVYKNGDRKNQLSQSGYNIINVDYAKDPNILLRLVNSRISLHNKSSLSQEKFLLLDQILTNKSIEQIAKLTDGNIRKILCVAKMIYQTKENLFLTEDKLSKFIVSALYREKNGRHIMPTKTLHI